MNWDWDKLQEKRRHQPGNVGKGKETKDSQSDNDANQSENKDRFKGNLNDLFGTKDKRENPFKYNNNGNNGNNGDDGGNRNRTPFNKDHDPRQIIEKINLPGLKWIIPIVLLLWLATGFFIVRPDEAGVILRFGAYDRTVDAGMHYHLPYPIETVSLPKVTQVRQIIVGQGNSNIQNDEAAMLTGDENIVNIQFSIQYYIKSDGVVDYLYKVLQPDSVVKKAAEAAMREVIGKNTLDNALTIGRNQIQTDVETLLQSILDSYEVGIQVVAVQMQEVQPPVPVRDAFKDVASAREDKERLTNEAKAYSNDILPKAQGFAAEKLNQAEAYKQTRVRNAEGEASRFLAILEEYNKAKDVTEKRLLLETMEKILSNPYLDKVVLPSGMDNQVLPFLPLGPNNLGGSMNGAVNNTQTSSNIANKSVQTPSQNDFTTHMQSSYDSQFSQNSTRGTGRESSRGLR